MLVSEKDNLKNLFSKLPKWKGERGLKISDKCAKVRLFTEEQILAAQEKGKQIFQGKVGLPNGSQFEYPYLLVTYEDIIRNAL